MLTAEVAESRTRAAAASCASSTSGSRAAPDHVHEEGGISGSPHYLAPERARRGRPRSRTDVYALGVLGYLMFTGTLPFDGDIIERADGAHRQDRRRRSPSAAAKPIDDAHRGAGRARDGEGARRSPRERGRVPLRAQHGDGHAGHGPAPREGQRRDPLGERARARRSRGVRALAAATSAAVGRQAPWRSRIRRSRSSIGARGHDRRYPRSRIPRSASYIPGLVRAVRAVAFELQADRTACARSSAAPARTSLEIIVCSRRSEWRARRSR